MNRVVKTFLVWLLALALPMQGYAAATMFTCQTALPHPSHRMHQSMHHGEVMAASGAHQHEHDFMRQASDSVPHHAVSGKHGHTSCSPCPVCCIGVAVMPASLEWQSPYTGAEMSAATPVVSFSGHIPSGLDRPPRVLPV